MDSLLFNLFPLPDILPRNTVKRKISLDLIYLDLYGKNDHEAAKIDSIIDGLQDVRAKVNGAKTVIHSLNLLMLQRTKKRPSWKRKSSPNGWATLKPSWRTILPVGLSEITYLRNFEPLTITSVLSCRPLHLLRLHQPSYHVPQGFWTLHPHCCSPNQGCLSTQDWRYAPVSYVLTRFVAWIKKRPETSF